MTAELEWLAGGGVRSLQAWRPRARWSPYFPSLPFNFNLDPNYTYVCMY
jgi:hypothetical protein